MFKCLCKHKYHLLTVYEKDVDVGIGFDMQKIFIIYCPRCSDEMEVREHVYNKIIARQKVDEEYERTRENKDTQQS